MKIERIETIRLKSYGNLIWVKVHADNGQHGFGESFMWPASVEAHIHETMAPMLLGEDPRTLESHWRTMYGYLGFRSSGAEMRALSAIDIALWDLWGKSLGLPVYQLLGGKFRSSIATYNTCAGYSYIRDVEGQHTDNWGLPEGDSVGPYEDLNAFLTNADALAESLLDEGIGAMKIWPFDYAAEESSGNRITNQQLNEALEPFRKIRKAVGDRIDIMVEMHSLWNLTTAIEISKALEPFNIFWIEDPIKMNSLSNLADFRQRTRIPVTASETLATRWGYKDALELRACDYVMPDLGWTGGISEAKKIATMAEAYGLPIAPHDCTGPVVFSASTHLCLASPNAVFQESVRALYSGWYKDVVQGLPAVQGGRVSVSDAPGLGIDFLPGIEERSDALVRISN